MAGPTGTRLAFRVGVERRGAPPGKSKFPTAEVEESLMIRFTPETPGLGPDFGGGGLVTRFLLVP